MAKPATLQIKLLSTADTGFFYVTKKNPRTKPEKLELKKYDPSGYLADQKNIKITAHKCIWQEKVL